jgi:adenylate cyclase
VPLDGMAAAISDGTLSLSYLDATAFDRFTGLSGTTFQELSARTGIPLELLMVVREAVGFAAPRPEDHVHQNELSVVPEIELLSRKWVPPRCHRAAASGQRRQPAQDRRDGDRGLA